MTVYIDPAKRYPDCRLRPRWDLETGLCGPCYLLAKAFGNLERWKNEAPAWDDSAAFEQLKAKGLARDSTDDEFDFELRRHLGAWTAQARRDAA